MFYDVLKYVLVCFSNKDIQDQARNCIALVYFSNKYVLPKNFCCLHECSLELYVPFGGLLITVTCCFEDNYSKYPVIECI